MALHVLRKQYPKKVILLQRMFAKHLLYYSQLVRDIESKMLCDIAANLLMNYRFSKLGTLWAYASYIYFSLCWILCWSENVVSRHHATFHFCSQIDP